MWFRSVWSIPIFGKSISSKKRLSTAFDSALLGTARLLIKENLYEYILSQNPHDSRLGQLGQSHFEKDHLCWLFLWWHVSIACVCVAWVENSETLESRRSPAEIRASSLKRWPSSRTGTRWNNGSKNYRKHLRSKVLSKSNYARTSGQGSRLVYLIRQSQ